MTAEAFNEAKELLVECGFNPINLEQSIGRLEEIILKGNNLIKIKIVLDGQ